MEGDEQNSAHTMFRPITVDETEVLARCSAPRRVVIEVRGIS